MTRFGRVGPGMIRRAPPRLPARGMTEPEPSQIPDRLMEPAMDAGQPVPLRTAVGELQAAGRLPAYADKMLPQADALFDTPTPADVVEVTILGLPAPQGSKSTFVPTDKAGNPYRKDGRILAQIIDANSKTLRPWRKLVKREVERVMAAGPRPVLAGPLIAYATFTMRKPVSAAKRRRTWPDTYPDVDKLLRALLDGGTDGGLYGDDGQVVAALAVKCYPGEPSTEFEWEHPLPEPGAHLRVTRLAWVPGEQL